LGEALRSDLTYGGQLKGLSLFDWLDDFLYLPEVMYIMIFVLLISSGPGRLSVDHWIAVRSAVT